jgi:type IV pilus assembly protein PilC
MPVFAYSGQLRSTNAISGTLEAENAEAAMAELQAVGIRVTSLAPTAAILPTRPLSRDDFLYFNQQLASLAETGVALDKGLRILAKDLRRGRLRKAVEEMAADLERGTPLSEAIDRRANLFPPLYAEILKSGVENNRLGTTLCNLNTHLLVMQDARRLFWESAIYPIIVAVLGFVVLSIFMVYVVPQQEELVVGFIGTQFWNFRAGTESEFTMPPLTQTLFAASHHWAMCSAILAGAVVGLLLVLYLLKLFPAGRRVREVLFSLVPGFYGVYKASLLSRFGQAAALGASAGHDLPRVLRLAAGATGHRGLVREAELLSGQIETGAPPSTAGSGTSLIPAIFCYTAQVAGRRGQLASALAEMARAYDSIARHRMVMLRMILTPIMLILVALLLGTGITAMFYPLVALINSLTGI